MKTIPSLLAADYAAGTTTLGHLLKITRTDALVFAFTSASDDVVISGVTYRSAPGLDISSIATSAGLAVGNLELTTLDDGSTFTRADVLSGRWRNAAFEISQYNWLTPANGLEPLLYGTVGNVELRTGTIMAELRDLRQYLQQPIGTITSKTCRARLGDTSCRVTLATYTFAGTVTTATSNQVFTASALTQAADYFGNGTVVWLTGANAGLRSVIKTHMAGGVLTLVLPQLLTVVVGDTFSAIAGCRKRHDRTSTNVTGVSDCYDKFNNVLNFQGERLLPGTDALTRPPV